jgi:hypothetical protein
VALEGATLGSFLTYWRHDVRWKDREPELGSAWRIMGASIILTSLIIVAAIIIAGGFICGAVVQFCVNGCKWSSNSPR